MSKFTIKDLTLAALIAAVYAVLTVALPVPAFSGVHFRVAEAMTVLPFLFPSATPGLFVGCIIANLFSPYPLDVVCGSAATLIACLLTQRMPNRWLASLPPVVCNMVIVGAEIAWFEAGFGPGFGAAYAFNALTVGLGELAACVYHSLAHSYAQSVQELSALTGREYTAVNIVGGGSQDGYLNQLTANATGLPVYAGPTEGTALGNLMVQMLAAGEFPDLAAIRKAVRHSFSIQEVLPC